MEQFLAFPISSFMPNPWMFPPVVAIQMPISTPMESLQPFYNESMMRLPTLPLKRASQTLEEEEEEKPMPRDLSQGARGVKWVDSEDLILRDHVKQHSAKCWATAAAIINKCVHDGKEVRNGKHCRERWYNHLNPDLKSNIHLEGNWSEDEDLKLLALHIDFGNCWSRISQQLQGRNENAVKNRYNSLIKKAGQWYKCTNIKTVEKKLYRDWQKKAETDNFNEFWQKIHSH